MVMTSLTILLDINTVEIGFFVYRFFCRLGCEINWTKNDFDCSKQTYQQQQLFSNLTVSFVNSLVSLNDALNTANTVSATNNTSDSQMISYVYIKLNDFCLCFCLFVPN